MTTFLIYNVTNLGQNFNPVENPWIFTSLHPSYPLLLAVFHPYTSRKIKTENHTRYLHFLENLPKLPHSKKAILDYDITLQELEDSI